MQQPEAEAVGELTVCGRGKGDESMQMKRRNGLASALLGMITCGLYNIYFWYRYGEDTNVICQEDQKTTQNYIVAWLLSTITLGIYGLYWTYQVAARLEQASDRYGVRMESSVIFTLVMRVPFLSFFYACDIMNKFADAYENPTPQLSQEQQNYNYYTGNGNNSTPTPPPTPIPTPPPVWPTSGQNQNSNPTGNGDGMNFGSTRNSTGNNMESDVHKSFTEAKPTTNYQNPSQARLSGICPNCGAEVKSSERYCRKCGYPVSK